MKSLFGLMMVTGLWAFAVGCGPKASVKETPPPPPTEAEIEENEEMGGLPGE